MILFGFFVLSVVGYSLCEDGPLVEIPQGKISGTYKKSYGGRTYSAFEGIPFAKPPVGDLRFAEPQPADKWDGILNANRTYSCLCFLPIKIMYGAFGKEDCLYAYVYVPKENINGDENLDVVVHIHGGAFMMGAPSFMSKPDYIMDKDVVYISFNYRLGILGFLSTEDDVVPGNNGLKDQVLALKWIKDNVKYFGGNPDSITITGLSAGAASVHYHYISPLSKGLFHRGFSQSGTALQNWAVTRGPLQYAKKVAEHLECDTSSSQAMVECLKKLPGKQLVEGIAVLFIFDNLIPFIPFGVVIEKHNSSSSFLVENPHEIMKAGRIYDVPWITSNVMHEGVIPAGLFYIDRKLKELYQRWNELMPLALDMQDDVEESQMSEIMTKVREKFLKGAGLSMRNIYDLVQVFTERLFFIGAEKAFRTHAQVAKSPVRYYWFNYTLEQQFLIPLMPKGVAHSDDGRLIFPTVMSPEVLSENDEAMMNILTDFISNYAANKEPEMKGVEWKPIDPSQQEFDYIHINGPDDITSRKIDQLCDKQFWNSLPLSENHV